MNLHKECLKILYHDGFDKESNHTLWKLKHKLTPHEWNSIKEHFVYYKTNDKCLSNVKYGGWMTTKPALVTLTLRKLKHKTDEQEEALC